MPGVPSAHVYFGRLIDTVPGALWRTAEINTYFYFELSASLRRLLGEPPEITPEGAACLAEGVGAHQQKLGLFISGVSQNEGLWQVIREHLASQLDVHFPVW